jgi:protein O-mannosyl-transferase
MLSNRSRILFLIFIVLGVYYPVIFSGANSVDDSKMIFQLETIEHADWKGLFLPGAGYYYRPLLMSTFIADKFLWGLSESFMHLENLLLHVVNTILVFLIAVKACERMDVKKLELPLLSALLFAMHPINTEPVAWISGRTDPLASMFVLLSVLALLKGLSEDRYRYLILSNLLLLLGCMCKEVAVFFLPAACLITMYWPSGSDTEAVTRRSGSRVKQILILIIPSLIGGASYLLLRLLAFRDSQTGISRIFTGIPYELYDMPRVVFKIFGFYVKKLFLPLPLNFAITKFDDRYVWLGLAVFVLLAVISFRRNIYSAFLLIAALLISPAILVAASRIAWTPIAERYLYLPSAFFAMGITGALYYLLNRFEKEFLLIPAAILVLVPSTILTAQRVLIWQDNLTLYQDTLKKSPDFISLKNELGIALMEHGRSDEADAELAAGQKSDSRKSNTLLYVNQARGKLILGKPAEARAILLPVAKDWQTVNVEVLKMLTKVDEKRLLHAKLPGEATLIQREIMIAHDHLYIRTGDPMSLYRGGQMAMFLGDKKAAAKYFQKAYDKSPEGTYYRPAAKKLAEKLKQ